MRKLRIAVFTDNYFPQVNGVVTAVHSSTKGLLKLGHKVLIFAPKNALLKRKTPSQYSDLDAEIIHVPSVPAIVYPGLRLSFPFLPVTILKIMKFQPDIIHFHTPLTVGMEGILAAKSVGKPLVGTFHTFFMEDEYLKNTKLSRLRTKKILRKVGWEYSNMFYNQADVVISPSKYTAINLKNNGCTKPVVNIPNSIDLPKHFYTLTDEERSKLRKNLKIKEGNKVIIWLGRLSPEKNLDVALMAYGLLLKKTGNVTFLLIGDGPARKSLEKLSKKEFPNGNVVFTGALDHNVLLKKHILQTGDAFFSASTSENQPISALEAMSEGLPLVVSDKRGMPEMIDGNGYVCEAGNTQEMADKLNILLTDPEVWKSLSIRSREVCRKYDCDVIAEKLEGLYEKVLIERGD